jgi:hypothetical protein
MAINFPDAPSVNDVFVSGNSTWLWNGTTWIDAETSVPLLKSGGTMTGDLVLSGDPSLANGAANKNYVDAKAPLLATFVTDATTARTLTASDANKTILFTSGSAVTLTINASTDLPVGSRVDIVQDGAGVLTVTASSATVAGAEVSTTTGSFTIGLQYSAASIICVATDTYRLIGNIAAV